LINFHAILQSPLSSAFTLCQARPYAKISVTTPEPTVLPPSRTANRSP
jgi:hypothetical protein